MSSDLEKFLQQAAERLAQKTGGKPPVAGRPRTAPSPSAAPRPQPTQPLGQPSTVRRPPPVAEIIEAEVLDADERRARAMREAGPDPLSTIDTRPSLAQSISQADERMGQHVQHVFAHELSHLPAVSQPLMGSKQANQTDQVIEVVSRKQYESPLVAMLRSPDTLRAAFIVGEIFRRRV
jgi:hypothetical protein